MLIRVYYTWPLCFCLMFNFYVRYKRNFYLLHCTFVPIHWDWKQVKFFFQFNIFRSGRTPIIAFLHCWGVLRKVWNFSHEVFKKLWRRFFRLVVILMSDSFSDCACIFDMHKRCKNCIVTLRLRDAFKKCHIGHHNVG